MPTSPTYPGVYIEEIPSGVRTITGVATSIAAFIGRALRGPTNEPITINSFGDFERIFGGLWGGSSLGFAVRDFYLNGGGADDHRPSLPCRKRHGGQTGASETHGGFSRPGGCQFRRLGEQTPRACGSQHTAAAIGRGCRQPLQPHRARRGNRCD